MFDNLVASSAAFVSCCCWILTSWLFRYPTSASDNFAKRLLHGALIDERHLLGAGFGKPDTVSNPPSFEDRLQRAGADAPQTRRTCEQPGESRTLRSADGGQRNLREIVCLGDADLCVRRHQLLLRLQDVRSAFEQRRRKSRGNLRWMWLVDERSTSSDAFGISSDEDADEVLLLFDPPFEIGDRGARRRTRVVRPAARPAWTWRRGPQGVASTAASLSATRASGARSRVRGPVRATGNRRSPHR